MLSLPAAFPSPSCLCVLRRKPARRLAHLFCSSAASSESTSEPTQQQRAEPHGYRATHAGIRLDGRVEKGVERSRLDAWISSRIRGVSRARVQASIRSGLVTVNGRTIDKVSHIIKAGDKISCSVSELQPLRAEPEDIPLDIVYEDAHILVVNKPAHMVVHPAPGNVNGTLVNAILHHCQLPTVTCADENVVYGKDDSSESSDSEFSDFFSDEISYDGTISRSLEASVRPGIVHRLDKGTSGLLVVAKDEHSHAHLAEQFKQHSIHRVYISLTSGVPSPTSGRVEVPIARDSVNRIRMTAVSGLTNARGARSAASRYKVIEVFAGGGSALVEWRLETGRTHQIRAHAKYLGIPLLGDVVYGGTKSLALSLLRPRTPSNFHTKISAMVSKLQRPCLHALSLGFKHPHTGRDVHFSCPPPPDFTEVLGHLQKINSECSSKSR